MILSFRFGGLGSSMSAKSRRLAPKAMLAVFFYLIIPLCSIFLILKLYPELPAEMMYHRIYWVLPTGTVIVMLAQWASRYRHGETKRYALNLCFTAATLVWMYGLLGGGLVITSQWNGYDFSLHMDKYLMLILGVAALNVLYYTFEWQVFRKEKSFRQSHKKNNPRRIVD
jgi:EamA domain-containing membrane protein RarD